MQRGVLDEHLPCLRRGFPTQGQKDGTAVNPTVWLRDGRLRNYGPHRLDCGRIEVLRLWCPVSERAVQSSPKLSGEWKGFRGSYDEAKNTPPPPPPPLVAGTVPGCSLEPLPLLSRCIKYEAAAPRTRMMLVDFLLLVAFHVMPCRRHVMSAAQPPIGSLGTP